MVKIPSRGFRPATSSTEVIVTRKKGCRLCRRFFGTCPCTRMRPHASQSSYKNACHPTNLAVDGVKATRIHRDPLQRFALTAGRKRPLRVSRPFLSLAGNFRGRRLCLFHSKAMRVRCSLFTVAGRLAFPATLLGLGRCTPGLRG